MTWTAILIYYQVGVWFLPGFSSRALCDEAVRSFKINGSAYYGNCVRMNSGGPSR